MKYNPTINSDPSGHFTNKELEYIFGENYEAEIQKYSYQMQILLNTDDFTFGDMVIYNIDGVQHWGILITDSNNSLAILDLEEYTTISIGYDFEPIAAYDNQSKMGQYEVEAETEFTFLWGDRSIEEELPNITLYKGWETFDDKSKIVSNDQSHIFEFKFDFLDGLGLAAPALEWAIHGTIGAFGGTGIAISIVATFHVTKIDVYTVEDVPQPLGN